MSESTRSVKRGTILKAGGLAIGAIVADLMAQLPADAAFPINMSCTSTTGLGVGRGQTSTVKIYIWDYGTVPPVGVPDPGSGATFIFDNRVADKLSPSGYVPNIVTVPGGPNTSGGTLVGYYGDAGNDHNEMNPSPHPNLFIVITK